MVQRNVCYHKNLETYREVDISYYLLNEAGLKRKKLSHVIVEAKYLNEGPLRNKLRSGEKKKRGQLVKKIDSLVIEILERQAFVKGDYSILVTNKEFEKELIREAERAKIKLIDGKQLQKMYELLGYEGPIEYSIRQVNIAQYMNYRSHIYLDRWKTK